MRKTTPKKRWSYDLYLLDENDSHKRKDLSFKTLDETTIHK
jgi:hypothetical protein